MEFRRAQYNTVVERVSESRSKIQVVIGPRQVGKSTMMAQVVKDLSIPVSFHSADEAPDRNSIWIRNIWESCRAKMQVYAQTEHLLVIDEIQRMGNWSEAVKAEWDADTRNKINLKVVLLGSSRVMIMKGLTESLAGRFELIRMPHWSYSEMREAFGFTLDQYIYFGGYPGSAQYVNNETRWRKYIKDSIVEAAINKDVFQTATVYKPALLRQLFELGCAYSGEIVSLNKMLGQLTDAGNVTTLASYLTLLRECHLLCGLQKFANDHSRKYASAPKLQVFNNALKNANLHKKFEQERIDTASWGRQVESAVGSHIINMADTADYKVYYWRENSKEVDFILSKGERLVALEVKSGKRSTNEGMAEFKEKFNPIRSLVIGTGGFSVEEFLSMDLDWLWKGL